MNRIQAAWEAMNDKCIPIGTPMVQRVEMRRAFFAGASAILMINVELGSTKASGAEVCCVLDELCKELIAFTYEVGSSAEVLRS